MLFLILLIIIMLKIPISGLQYYNREIASIGILSFGIYMLKENGYSKHMFNFYFFVFTCSIIIGVLSFFHLIDLNITLSKFITFISLSSIGYIFKEKGFEMKKEEKLEYNNILLILSKLFCVMALISLLI